MSNSVAIGWITEPGEGAEYFFDVLEIKGLAQLAVFQPGATVS